MANELSGYELSRVWFDFCFENPEIISPNHTAIYFFAIEHCNRLGWKEKFGFPTQMTMDAIGIKKHSTYMRYFNDICEWGFFNLVQKSVNQYSANIISLANALPKKGRALGKAMLTHAAKQTLPMRQSKRSIDKPYNNTNNTNLINPETELIENLIIDEIEEIEFNNMPIPKDCGELPEVIAGSAKELIAITKYKEVPLKKIFALWPVFLTQNITGKKYYPDIGGVHSYFINWVKGQQFEDLKPGEESKEQQKANSVTDQLRKALAAHK